MWTLTAGNTYCSVGYIPRGYRRYCVDTHSWQYLLFSGIHPKAVSQVLCGHSQLAIHTVQWDTSTGAIVGTVWTLTAGNTHCLVGHIPRGYRKCFVWTLTAGNTYCLVGYIPGVIIGTAWTLQAGTTYCSVEYIPGVL